MIDNLKREVFDCLPGSAVALLCAFTVGFLLGKVVRVFS
jgi:hypothetical protein